MKVGIMGGTFDPIHMGHLILAQQAKEQFQLDQIRFMPNGNPQYKQDHVVSNARHRIRMTELAIEDNPCFSIELAEVNRQGYTYTYETMEALQKLHPEESYYFIIGADSLFAMESWKYPERIASTCTILAANRDGHTPQELTDQIRHLQEQLNMNVRLMNCPSLEISSAGLRKMVCHGQSIRYYVPEKVYQYILTQGLYKNGTDGTVFQPTAPI